MIWFKRFEGFYNDFNTIQKYNQVLELFGLTMILKQQIIVEQLFQVIINMLNHMLVEPPKLMITNLD